MQPQPPSPSFPVISFTAQKGMKGLGFLEETLDLIAPWVDTSTVSFGNRVKLVAADGMAGLVGTRKAEVTARGAQSHSCKNPLQSPGCGHKQQEHQVHEAQRSWQRAELTGARPTLRAGRASRIHVELRMLLPHNKNTESSEQSPGLRTSTGQPREAQLGQAEAGRWTFHMKREVLSLLCWPALENSQKQGSENPN